MNDNKLKDRINNENIWSKLEVAPRQNKMREDHLRWCGHVYMRPIDATVINIDSFQLDRNSQKLRCLINL